MTIVPPRIGAARARRARGAVRALFVGNSYTTRNDLPALITTLAAAAPAPRHVETGIVSAGGASLRRHWNAGTALAAIRDEPWNYVVLQEQSTLPLKNAARFRDNVRLLAHAVREHGATTVLYLTWARRDAPQTQAAVTAVTVAVATDVDAQVVPVGPAWQLARSQHPDIELYLRDGSHPTAAGSYLTACVFVSALLGVAPMTLPMSAPLGLDAGVAERLRQVATATCEAWSGQA